VADADEFGEVAGSMFDFICSCISPLLKSIALAVVFRAVCVHLFAIHIRDSEFSLFFQKKKQNSFTGYENGRSSICCSIFLATFLQLR